VSALSIHHIIIIMPKHTRSCQEVEDLQKQQEKLEERLNTDCSSINDAVAGNDANELEVLLAHLKSRVERWEDVTRRIMAKMDEDDRGDEMDRCEDIRDDVIRAQTNANRVIFGLHRPPVVPPVVPLVVPPAGAPAASSDSSKDSDDDKRLAIAPALPKLKFPVFNGDYLEWLPWWNRFKSAIHENKRLHAIDKFNLLRSHTGGRAADAIRNLDVTVDNYQPAVDILRKRFEKADFLQATHVNPVIAMPSVDKRENYAALRTLHDQVVGHTTSLKSAGLEWEKFAPIVMPIIISKLPATMRAEWRKLERNSACTFKDLLGFIDEEAEEQEYAALIDGAKGKAPEKPKADPSTIASAAQLAATATSGRANPRRPRKSCPFCQDPHFAIKCSWSRDKKMTVVDADKRCIRCLRRNHAPSECKAGPATGSIIRRSAQV
jgi:Protein of unknown function (DUF1759)